MKRIISFFVIFVLLCLFAATPVTLLATTTNAPNRVINLVYDDSGSMIKSNNIKVDTWCQAKYAMEVFAAMLGEKDKLNLYYMSDFDKSSNAAPKLALSGTDGATVNVSKVHKLVTNAGNTSFNTVRKAYSDLVSSSADEKWLVVLTDGEFQGVDDVDAFFSEKSADVNVMFLGMGEKAEGITANESNNIYYEKAQTNKEILSKITGICTRVFNSNRLEVSKKTKTFSFDVPMSELIVFAQGAKVKINGIKGPDGKTIKSTSKPVTVKYSDKAAPNYTDFIIDKNLVGSIATFDGDYDAGEYQVDVSGAETIEIYYKPNIEIAAYLKDKDGNEVTDLSDLEAGEYVIEFGFVKAGTEEKIGSSKLLGNVSYEAYITNNGTKLDGTYDSGDSIVLEEGDLSIDVTGSYLDYNSVSTHRDYSIFKDKTVSFEIYNDRTFEVTSEGMNNKEPIQIKAYLDGKDVTDEQWNNMEVPEVNFTSGPGFDMGDFKVQKSDETGVFDVYPNLGGDKPGGTTYENAPITVSYYGTSGSEAWEGSSELELKMNDSRSWFEKNRNLIIKLIILLILLIIAIGYLPFIKHYLPKSLKKKPLIEKDPNLPGMERKLVSGKYEKKTFNTIMPYVAERGTIKFLPNDASARVRKSFYVKGSKRNMMIITNIREFANKENITFNGMTIDKDNPKKEYSAGVTIKVETNDWNYICQPNQEIIRYTVDKEKKNRKKSKNKKRK